RSRHSVRSSVAPVFPRVLSSLPMALLKRRSRSPAEPLIRHFVSNTGPTEQRRNTFLADCRAPVSNGGSSIRTRQPHVARVSWAKYGLAGLQWRADIGTVRRKPVRSLAPGLLQ